MLRLCLGAGDGGARGFAETERRKVHESRRRRKGVEDMRNGEEVRRGKEMCAHHSLDATRRYPRSAGTHKGKPGQDSAQSDTTRTEQTIMSLGCYHTLPRHYMLFTVIGVGENPS